MSGDEGGFWVVLTQLRRTDSGYGRFYYSAPWEQGRTRATGVTVQDMTQTCEWHKARLGRQLGPRYEILDSVPLTNPTLREGSGFTFIVRRPQSNTA